LVNYRIIDAHAHIFPDKIADRAVASIGGFYNMTMLHSGTAAALIRSGSEASVEKYLICSTATTVEQVESINDFIYDECCKHPEFIGLGTLHPNMSDYEKEIKRVAEMGFKGVKIHPDFQHFYIDDAKMMPLYKMLERYNLLVLCHVGGMKDDFSSPYRLANVAKTFPKLTLIAPHFGGWQQWDEATRYLNLPNVYFDTSSSLYTLDKRQVLSIFEKLFYKKFFFGTDFPMWDHKEEVNRFLDLELGEEMTQDILYNNFAKLFLD